MGVSTLAIIFPAPRRLDFFGGRRCRYFLYQELHAGWATPGVATPGQKVTKRTSYLKGFIGLKRRFA
jgi:hypothetical protein